MQLTSTHGTWWYAPLVDLLFVLLFVGIGRHTHDHGLNVGGMVSTAWPFGVGLAVAWLLVTWRHRQGGTALNGFVIVLITVALGMLLRVLSGQGTAIAFIIVAVAFLSLFFVGWRLVDSRLLGRP